MTVHPLPRSGKLTLGRAEGNDVRIDHPSVSRRHAVLHVGPPLRVEDLGGANGTYVRDTSQPLEGGATQKLRQVHRQTVDVALGDSIALGTTMVVVQRAAAGIDPG